MWGMFLSGSLRISFGLSAKITNQINSMGWGEAVSSIPIIGTVSITSLSLKMNNYEAFINSLHFHHAGRNYNTLSLVSCIKTICMHKTATNDGTYIQTQISCHQQMYPHLYYH